MIIMSIAALAAAAIIAYLALRLVAREREAFGLERVALLDRLERHHCQTAALVDEHGDVVSQILRQHAEERTILLAEHRSDIRELLNRFQFPAVMPVATRPQPQQQAAPSPGEESARDRARRAWAQIGRVAPPAPDRPADTDDMGSDVP